ncbi:nucleotide-diphospho-sugar transferase, partial [Dimargaris cristalligena]
MSYAYVTLVTSNDYAQGAVVLAHSLRQSGTSYPLVCLITPSTLTPAATDILYTSFDRVVPVSPFDSGDHTNLKLLGRPDLGVTWTKFELWRLTEYSKIVFLDADTLVLRNLDDLFATKGPFAAAPDIGWPDCFNSGVMVCTPDQRTWASLRSRAEQEGSFDGGDQGLLNDHFSNWSTAGPEQRLAFADNFTASAGYSYAPAFQRFGDRVRVVHFIGHGKPW